MSLRGTDRLNYYLVWTIVSLAGMAVLFFLKNLIDVNLVILAIVFILLIKDVVVDIGKKKGPTPNWLEHAPVCDNRINSRDPRFGWF